MTFFYFYALIALLWLGAAILGYRRRVRDDCGLLRDVGAIAGLAVLTVAFFWRPLFLEGTAVPRGGGDLASFLYPVYSFAATNLQNGVLPLWNPHLYSGSPFAADMQTGLFYPINLLAFLTARPFTYVTMEELAIVHFFLAACFTYIYARSLAVSRVSSFAAGVIFAFGGFVTAHLGHLNMIAAAIWLPLILTFFHRAVTRGSVSSAALAGAIFGISILAGHTQITLYMAFTLSLYWLWQLLAPRLIPSTPPRRAAFASISHSSAAERQIPAFASISHSSAAERQVPGTPATTSLGAGSAISQNAAARSTWLRGVSLPITGLIAFGVSALQLLPTYELTRLSLRADITYAKATEFAASPSGLITLLVPHFFGDNPAAFWGLKWNLTEVYGYVGIMPLVLALLAMVVWKRRSGMALFFAVLALLALLLSLGEYTVLYGWLYKFVPGFDKVRSAGRFLLLFDFAIALLAAFGLDTFKGHLRKRERPSYRMVQVFGLATLAGSVFIATPFYYSALLTSQDKDPMILQRIQEVINSLNLSVLFLAASVVALVLNRYLRRGRPALVYGAVLLIVVDLFSANAGYNPTTESVVSGFSHPQVLAFLKDHTNGQPGRIDSVTNVWDVWQPDTTLLNQVDDLMGIFNPMLLADYNRYWENLGGRSNSAYDLLNAKYVVAHKDVPLDWQKFRPVVTDAPDVNVYENTKVLPRAMLVPTVEAVARDKMLDLLRSPSFDPRRLALVEDPVEGLSTGSAGEFDGRVLETKYPSPNELQVRTQSNRASLLVVSDVDYPGWIAFVDGKESRVLRADYAFKSVVVPAGAHEVRLVFKPRIWEIGLAISGLTWLLLFAWAAVSFINSRRTQSKTV